MARTLDGPLTGAPAAWATRCPRRGSRRPPACPAWRSPTAPRSRSFTPTTCFTRSSRKYVFSGVNEACGSTRSTYASMGFVGDGVEVDARRLAHAHAADLALGNEGAQVDLAQVHQRDDRRAGHHDLARLGRARGDGARERRDDPEVLPVGARLLEHGAGALGLGLRGGDVRLRLEDLSLHRGHLRGANRRVREIRLRGHRASRGRPRPGAATPTPPRPAPPRVLCARRASCSAISSRWNRRANASRSHLACVYDGLGLRQLRLGRGQPPLGLADLALRVAARLVDPDLRSVGAAR